jgi:hypothetical protein
MPQCSIRSLLRIDFRRNPGVANRIYLVEESTGLFSKLSVALTRHIAHANDQNHSTESEYRFYSPISREWRITTVGGSKILTFLRFGCVDIY